jgi:threonine dehydrogenase-like Zn-dependent dehydrogenase
MRALLLESSADPAGSPPGPATLRFEPYQPAPIATEGEALIQVRQAGICNTDLELHRGYMGFSGIPGHEFVGTLIDGPSGLCDEAGRELSVGCRVVAEINCSPFPSPLLASERSHDPRRTTLGIFRRHGAFAELLTVPAVNLHRVPDEVSDDQAIFVEPLAAALQILTQLHLSPSDRVAVLGDGKLGLLCSQVLAQGSAAEVWAIGKHPSKLGLLGGRGVETCLVDELATQPGRRVPRLFDVVVECTGSPQGLGQALGLLRPRGTLVLKSTYAPPSPMSDPGQRLADLAQLQQALTKLVIDEITVVGSRCGPFAPALRLLAAGRVSVEPLVQARYRLEEGVAAFRTASAPGVLKVVLAP